MTDQYLVVVSNFRTDPRFRLYKVPSDSPVDVSGLMQLDSGSVLTDQLTEPNGVSTFTLSTTEP